MDGLPDLMYYVDLLTFQRSSHYVFILGDERFKN